MCGLSRAGIHRRVELWLLAAATIAAALFDTIGNVRVVDAIGSSNWTDDQAGSLGPSRPGFTSGHDLAQMAMYAVVGAVLVLTPWLWWRGAIGKRVAITAIAVNIVIPPWIIPGAGLIVLVGVAIRAKATGPEHRSSP